MPNPRLIVAPDSGHCVEFEAMLLNRVFPKEVGTPARAYFKGRTDADGKVISIDVLYTQQPELRAEIAAFVLDNLLISSSEVSGMPLEFFGSISIANYREVGYIVGGVFAPAEFERPTH